MNSLVCYKTMPEWGFTSFPKAFRQQHNTKKGTWAKLTILAGELTFYNLDENGTVLNSTVYNSDSDMPFIDPQAWHKVEPLSEDLRCQLAFYCKADAYYQKKYKLSAVHSELYSLIEHIKTGEALDLGCGGGRNALFLQQQGFNVTAFDKNPDSIEKLQAIIKAEQLNQIDAFVSDAHTIHLKKTYDVIVSTVVLMFLAKEQIPHVIHTMQNHTKPNGYNLIVCAIDSPDYPLSDHELPFGFAFKPNELADYYRDWEIKKYNEDVGSLHRLDKNGNPIKLRFATLIAKKAKT